ncbi:MAG: prepilin-type N-terminal cleavage/methylation domain-containing protein [Candidatus Omnitrophica bacterium]|nr:prepilin-type N-terminal cleavage/methylation domain-containing protein [Candidatus Omnitrophota bacterium]
MQKTSFTDSRAGVTLLEIMLAMLIFTLVTGGVFSAFVFSRKVNWRSETEIMVQHHIQEVQEKLRLAVAGALADGTTLAPGYYVDNNMASPPNAANGTAATKVTWLNLPTELQRFATASGEGVYLYVERADENNNGITDEDYDGDTLIGQDFDNDDVTDTRRVRLRIRWTVPSQ